ncbi:MAG: hypothetical protein R2713_12490 [Ilumatobacteraceae bacterium]
MVGGAFGATTDRIQQHLGVFGDERVPSQPSAKFARQLQRLRAQGGQVDRQVGLGWDRRLQRFALAARAGST